MFYKINEKNEVVRAVTFVPVNERANYIESEVSCSDLSLLFYDPIEQKIKLNEATYNEIIKQQLVEARKAEISAQLDELRKDFCQAFAGKKVDDIEFRRVKYCQLYDELCALSGLTPKENAVEE